MSAKANPTTPEEIKELLDQLPEDQAEAILKAAGLLALKLQKKAAQDKQRKDQQMTSPTSAKGLMNRDEAPMTVFKIPETGMRIIPKRERNAQGKWELTSGARKMLQELAEDTKKSTQD